MAELKLCPFCGRIPMVEDCGNNRYFVGCKCGIAQDKLYGQKCDAVRRWNTRKPSAQQWIPCSERMPDDGETVLVTRDDGTCKIATFEVGEIENGWQMDSWYTEENVTAWMPLPNPYKGEKNAINERSAWVCS